MPTPTAPPTSKRRAAAAVLYVALALAAFVATSRALAELMPRHVPAVDVKRDYFAAHKDEYTAVYIGTSMIHRHIVPAELPERSFNFGVARMTFAEASVLLDWIVSLRPARLERVVIDAHLFTDSGELNHFSASHIWWHTPRETLGAVQRTRARASGFPWAANPASSTAMLPTQYNRAARLPAFPQRGSLPGRCGAVRDAASPLPLVAARCDRAP